VTFSYLKKWSHCLLIHPFSSWEIGMFHGEISEIHPTNRGFPASQMCGLSNTKFLDVGKFAGHIHFRRFLDIWWIPLNKHKLVMVYPFIPTILSLVGFIIPRISHQLLVKICFNFAQAQLPRGRFHFLKPSFISIDKMLNLVINQLTVQGALLLSTNNSTNKLP